VELAHAGDDRLPGLLVRRDPERGILLREALERRGELVLVATEITGSGNVIDSSRIGAASDASVSPVVDCFSPTTAAISPAPISSRSSRWLACIWRMRPIRSVLPFAVLRTRFPVFTWPE
jgi:hypothetical protein